MSDKDHVDPFPVPLPISAFPLFAQTDVPSFWTAGMSLRDYFAAQALQGWLASYGESDQHPATLNEHAKTIAEFSYKIADAMMEARG